MGFWPSPIEITCRLALAAALGAVLGLEREWSGKPAGLRTHTLVCMGAATFTLVSIELFARIEEMGLQTARVDPTRIIEGLVGGIGFLGAGSIIQSRGNVEGLTTASCLWVVGAIGIAAGGGHYLIAGVSAGIALVVVLGLGFLERKFRGAGAAADAIADERHRIGRSDADRDRRAT